MTKTSAVRFAVSDVALATTPIEEIPYGQALAALVKAEPEAHASGHSMLIKTTGINSLLAAVHRAFQDHRPLSLSPDMIWVTLCQGLATHVAENRQALRDRFVSFQGKRPITIRRDDFVKGAPDNPWPEVFSEFSDAIEEEAWPASPRPDR